MKQQTKQLNFQQDGPYRDYTLRWVRLHKENNQRLLLVLLPTVLYMFTANAWFLMAGLGYLAAALLYGKYQQKRLLQELTVLEQQQFTALQQGMDRWGLPVQRKYTFGYCRSEGSFKPVFLCRCGNTFDLWGQVLVKNCIYGMEGQMLYLLDVNSQALEKAPEHLAISQLTWEKAHLCHQDLLRQEGLRLNDFLVIESFIYGLLLEEMKSGQTKKLLPVSWHLTRMRKEPVWQTALPDGRVLLLPKLAWELLEPQRQEPGERAGEDNADCGESR